MAVLEVETRQAELLLDELKPPASELPKGEAWERYAGALAMVESLGLSWSRNDEGRHRIGICAPSDESEMTTPPLCRTRLEDVPSLRLGIRVALARRDDTPTEVLSLLAHDPELKVRRCVAHNTHTPSHALLALAQEDDSEIKTRLALNPNTPPEALDTLVKYCEENCGGLDGVKAITHLLPWILVGPGLTAALQARLMRVWNAVKTLSKDLAEDEPQVRRQTLFLCYPLAINTDTPEAILRDLASSRSDTVRGAVARNRRAPSEVVDLLARDPSSSVASDALRSPNVSRHSLRRAFESEVGHISEPSALSKLGTDTSDYVRYMVARNTSTPVDTLEDLLDDKCEEVRREAEFTLGRLQSYQAVTLKHHTVEPIGWAEARDRTGDGPLWDRYQSERHSDSSGLFGISNAIASNQNLPEDLRDLLLMLGNDSYVLAGLASNPSTASNALSKLAANGDPKVRVAVASNPSTTRETLRLLAKDEDDAIRRAVARNAGVDDETLLDLCGDNVDNVRFSVISNKEVSTEAFLEDMSHIEEPWLRWDDEHVTSRPSLAADVVQMLKGDENEVIRAMVAAKEIVPAALLAKMAEDESDLVRQATASNPSTPAEVLLSLAHDQQSSVRSAAYVNPSLGLIELTET